MEQTITQQPVSGLRRFNQMITNPKTGDYLQSVLGKRKDTFVNNLTAIVSNNAALQECDPITLMYAAIKATTLNMPLDPNLGFVHIIPFKNTKKRCTEAQVQFGYKAFVQLAARGGEVEKINVTEVREGEILGRDRRTGDCRFEWIEDDAEREKKPIIGYLGYIRLRNGYEKELYKSKTEIDLHGRKYSQTYRNGYGVWKDNFDAMARKTILKMMLNKGDIPMSVEMAEARMYDQAVIDDNGYRYVDNEQETIEVSAEESAKAADMLSQALDGAGDNEGDMPDGTEGKLDI